MRRSGKPTPRASRPHRRPQNSAGPPLPSGYKIRLATNRDSHLIWLHISRILESCGIAADIETTDQDLENIEDSYRTGAFYTLWHEERLVATAAFRMVHPGHAELGRMYVAQEYRGKGIGSFLLRHLTKAATDRGARLLTLKTASVLKEAIQLYSKHGFALQQGQKCGNCDVTMVKEL
jgi:putative acetyltransferase